MDGGLNCAGCRNCPGVARSEDLRQVLGFRGSVGVECRLTGSCVVDVIGAGVANEGRPCEHMSGV